MTTPIYGLPELEPAQNQPEVTVNAALRQLEIIISELEFELPDFVVPYEARSSVTGAPTADQIVMRHRFGQVVDMGEQPYEAGIAYAGVAATAQTDFDIQRNGVSVGTLRFEAAATEGQILYHVTSGVEIVEPGDLLTIVAPTTPDATLADIDIILFGVLWVSTYP